MAAGAATVLAELAASGIEAAKVAVLAVLGLMVSAAAAIYGVRKVLALLGSDTVGVPSDSAGAAQEWHDFERSSQSEASGDWVYAWDNANGTRGVDDIDKWRN